MFGADDLTFKPLASSSAGCCYLLSGGGTAQPLLIECGISMQRISRGLDYQVTNLAGCLVSHAHGDHCHAVEGLVARGIDVYASRETWSSLPNAQNAYNAKTLEPRSDVMVGDCQVLPFEAIHDLPGTLGFVVGSPDGSRLLYLTDSMYSPFTFEGLTHLAVECNYSNEIIRDNAESGAIDRARYRRTMSTHMSLETLIDLLKANDLSRVEAIYLLHLSNANSCELQFRTAVQAATGVPTYVAAETAN